MLHLCVSNPYKGKRIKLCSRVGLSYTRLTNLLLRSMQDTLNLRIPYMHTHPELPGELPSNVLVTDSVPLSCTASSTVSCLYKKSYCALTHIRRKRPRPGLRGQTHSYRKQKPCPQAISERNNEIEQCKCCKKRLLGKFDEMIQNESLTEEKSCRSNGSLRSYSPGRHKPCLLKRLDIIVTRHYSVTIPSNPAPIRREPKLNWCGTTAESHVAASSYKVWVSRCLKAGPPASYYLLQSEALV